MSTLTVADDVWIHYTDHPGDRDPVVLIHGWPLNQKSWDGQVQELTKAGHRVVTYDRRGFGESCKNAEHYDYDTLANDLHQLMEHLDLRQATLVGFSMGGGEVARYLGTHGSLRIKSAVLLSAVTPYLLKDDSNPKGPLPRAGLEELKNNAKSPVFFPVFAQMFYGVDGESAVDLDVIENFTAAANLASADAVVETAESWGATDFRADLAKIDVPVLVLHGDSDACVPFEFSGKLANDAIKDSMLTILHDAPHGVLDSHADQVSDILVDWVRR